MTPDLTVLINKNGTTHERYDAVIPSAYLLRPDGYVGFRSRPTREGPLIEYLDERLSLPTTAWRTASEDTESAVGTTQVADTTETTRSGT